MRESFHTQAVELAGLIGPAVQRHPAQDLPSVTEFASWIEALLSRHGCESFFSGVAEPRVGERDRGLLRFLLKMVEITYRRVLQPWPPPDADLLARLRAGVQDRPPVLEEYAQAPVDLESSLRRALAVRRTLGPGPRSVLFVGDDDLTSLALALTEGLYKIWVIDIDEALLEFLSKRSAELGLDLTMERVDLLQDSVGFHLLGRFDAVVTDPVCEPEGCLTFLRFASECLSVLPASRIFWSDHPDWTVGHPWILASLRGIGLRLIETIEELHAYPPTESQALVDEVAQSLRLDQSWLLALHRSASAWSHLHVLGRLGSE